MADKAAPSTTAIAVAVGLIALTFGYFLGQGSSLGLFGGSKKSNKVPKSWPNSYDVTIHADSSDDEAGGNEDEDPEEGDELRGHSRRGQACDCCENGFGDGEG